MGKSDLSREINGCSRYCIFSLWPSLFLQMVKTLWITAIGYWTSSIIAEASPSFAGWIPWIPSTLCFVRIASTIGTGKTPSISDLALCPLSFSPGLGCLLSSAEVQYWIQFKSALIMGSTVCSTWRCLQFTAFLARHTFSISRSSVLTTITCCAVLFTKYMPQNPLVVVAASSVYIGVLSSAAWALFKDFANRLYYRHSFKLKHPDTHEIEREKMDGLKGRGEFLFLYLNHRFNAQRSLTTRL